MNPHPARSIFRTILVLGLMFGARESQAITISDDYLMTFHSCDISIYDCLDPANHYVRLAESNDLSSWSAISDFPTSVSGSVPDVVSISGYSYIYYLDNSGISTPTFMTIDQSTGSYSTSSFEVLDASGSPVSFVDPAPIEDSSGNIVLFYVKHTTIGGCSAYPCTISIHSATVDSSVSPYGSSFNEDAGARRTFTLASASEHLPTDPDVFAGPSSYIMMVARGADVYVYSNTSLNSGVYSPVPAMAPYSDLFISGHSVPSGLYVGSTYYIFAHDNGSPQHIRLATPTAINLTLYPSNFTTVMTGGIYGPPINYPPFTFSTASPGVAVVNP